MTLDITLSGSGSRIASLVVDGHRSGGVPADLHGHHQVRVELS